MLIQDLPVLIKVCSLSLLVHSLPHSLLRFCSKVSLFVLCKAKKCSPSHLSFSTIGTLLYLNRESSLMQHGFLADNGLSLTLLLEILPFFSCSISITYPDGNCTSKDKLRFLFTYQTFMVCFSGFHLLILSPNRHGP